MFFTLLLLACLLYVFGISFKNIVSGTEAGPCVGVFFGFAEV